MIMLVIISNMKKDVNKNFKKLVRISPGGGCTVDLPIPPPTCITVTSDVLMIDYNRKSVGWSSRWR